MKFYLCSNVGALKSINIILGVISIPLFFIEFVPVPEEIIFAASQILCLCISTIYLIVYLICWRNLIYSKVNLIIDFLFHLIAFFLLIFSGIDLARWSDYSDICADECPPFYLKLVSKILAFINGTLYGVVAFILLRNKRVIDFDPEFIEESTQSRRERNRINESSTYRNYSDFS